MGKNIGRRFFKQGLILMLMVIFLLPLNGYAVDPYRIISEDMRCNAPIWDMSGSYEEFFVDVNMAQDGKGKIIGSGCLDYYYGYGIDFDICFDVKGSIAQKNGIASINLSMKFTGTVDAPAEGLSNQKFKGTQKLTAEINPYNRTLIGTTTVKVNLAGHSANETVSFHEDLPYGMDGTWILEINAVDESGKKKVGSSLLRLANGRNLPFAAQGNYNSKKAETKFNLKGMNNARGCKLSPVIGELNGEIISMTGKVLGQTIKCK